MKPKFTLLILVEWKMKISPCTLYLLLENENLSQVVTFLRAGHTSQGGAGLILCEIKLPMQELELKMQGEGSGILRYMYMYGAIDDLYQKVHISDSVQSRAYRLLKEKPLAQ